MDKFIERKPPKAGYPKIVFKTLDEFEKYLDETKDWTGGSKIRNTDLSQLDFSSKKGRELLSRINEFDEETTWPEVLAEEKTKQLECGKNSGLGISSLHKKGYTGKGINIAIIDQCLLVNHPEYNDNIRYYKEMENDELLKKYGRLPQDGKASYHGPAVASLAVGTSCGSAPEAGLYFYSEGWRHSPNVCLKAIKHLIELNKTLSEKDKIRCLSCSWGGGPEEQDFEERMKLFKELEDTGCMVFGGCYGAYIGRHHIGASKIQQDSDSLDNLRLDPGYEKVQEDVLIVPKNQRTFASNSGGYLYEEQGGASWTYPYLAGLVACALQANPNIIIQKGWQDKIWKKLLETARLTPNRKGKIVQPEAFVMSVKGEKKKLLKKTVQNGVNQTIMDSKMKGKKYE